MAEGAGSKGSDKAVSRRSIVVEVGAEKRPEIQLECIDSGERNEDVKSQTALLSNNGVYSEANSPSARLNKTSLKMKGERSQSKDLLEAIKNRKYGKEYFEKRMKKQIGVTTLIGPRRENTLMKLQDSNESGSNPFERSQSLDFNEQIPDMDILLNNIDRNTSFKTKLEKAIIEFNQSPSKAFDFLWKEQIVPFSSP
eukprot:TRINITY_DN16061_c0_g2_i6.p1 TRINITY_DN16061_c0_g2~~TRINITY_DN16061_c0_g2_i6.p1  ORF type:complete len:220 (-),score=58.32 TRINITY_DN16061_c0_g2_i6:146-736(-)